MQKIKCVLKSSVRRNPHLTSTQLSNACKMKPGKTPSSIGQEDVGGGTIYNCKSMIGSLAASPHSYDDRSRR